MFVGHINIRSWDLRGMQSNIASAVTTKLCRSGRRYGRNNDIIVYYYIKRTRSDFN